MADSSLNCAASTRNTAAPRRLPRVWRWLGIGARALHLAALVLLGATILGAPPRAPAFVTGSVLLVSGIVLFALELWKTTDHVRQLAGASTFVKLALIAWMLVDPPRAEGLFWLIVLWSVVFAHVPASFRHAHVAAWLRR